MAQIGTTTKSVACPDWGNGSYTYKLTIIENSTDTPNNSHNVTVKFEILAVKSYYTNQADSDATFSITTDAGASYTPNSNVRGSHSTQYNNWVEIGSWTGDLTGNADGSLSITASVTYGWSSSYLPNNTTISLTASATTIPRASDISVVSTARMGTTISILVTQKTQMFSHKLYYKLGTESSYTLIGQSTSQLNKTYSFTIPDVSTSLPNANGTSCTLRCDTYPNITYNGTAMESTGSLTVTVPANYTPTISYVTDSTYPQEKSTVVKAITGWSASTWPFIQGYSIVAVKSSASGSHGSTVTNRTLTLGSESKTTGGTGAQVTTFTDVLANTSNTLTLRVLDSRGRQGTGSNRTILANAYTSPTVKINVARCLQDGTINALGTYAKVSLKWTWSSIKKTSNSSELNSATIKVYLGSSTTALITYNTTTNNQTSWVQMSTILSTYQTSSSYTFRAVITDKLSSNEDQVVLSKAEMPFSVYDAGSGVGATFGQMATEIGYNFYAQQVNIRDGKDLNLRASSTTTNDPGDLVFQDYSGTEVGRIWKDASTNRFLMRFSSSQSGQQIATLQAVYPVGSIYISTSSTNPGTTFGFGTWTAIGQGRVLMGVGTGTDSNSNTKTITGGETGGEYTHKLTTTEMPKHKHQSYKNLVNAAGTGTAMRTASGTSYGTAYNTAYDTTEAGGDGYHNIVQPYLGVYMWERTR